MTVCSLQKTPEETADALQDGLSDINPVGQMQRTSRSSHAAQGQTEDPVLEACMELDDNGWLNTDQYQHVLPVQVSLQLIKKRHCSMQLVHQTHLRMILRTH